LGIFSVTGRNRVASPPASSATGTSEMSRLSGIKRQIYHESMKTRSESQKSIRERGRATSPVTRVFNPCLEALNEEWRRVARIFEPFYPERRQHGLKTRVTGMPWFNVLHFLRVFVVVKKSSAY
jgi:hypothetical protein